MRLMLRFTIPVEKGNQAAEDGSMIDSIQTLVEQLQPESTYFYLQDGRRAGLVVFNAENASQMAQINEPLFSKLNAEIDIQPVLDLNDLAPAI